MNLPSLEYGKAADLSGADTGILIAVGEAYQNSVKKNPLSPCFRKASLIAGDNKDMHKES